MHKLVRSGARVNVRLLCGVLSLCLAEPQLLGSGSAVAHMRKLEKVKWHS